MNNTSSTQLTRPTTLRLAGLMFGVVAVATALLPLWQAAALIA